MSELRVLVADVGALGGDGLAGVVGASTPDVVAGFGAPRGLRWRSRRAALARRAGLVVATAHGRNGLLVLTTLATRVIGVDADTADVEVRGERWSVTPPRDLSEPQRAVAHAPSDRSAAVTRVHAHAALVVATTQ